MLGCRFDTITSRFFFDWLVDATEGYSGIKGFDCLRRGVMIARPCGAFKRL